MDNDDRKLTTLFEATNREFDDRREFARNVLHRIERKRRVRVAVLTVAAVAGALFAAGPMFQALPFAVEGLGSLVIGLLGQPVETHLRLVALLALPFLAAGLFRWLES